MSEYSFCESVTASGTSPWHIRDLAGQPRKLGGGITTGSLCGRVKMGMGWDLSVPIDAKQLKHACVTCAQQYHRTLHRAGCSCAHIPLNLASCSCGIVFVPGKPGVVDVKATRKLQSRSAPPPEKAPLADRIEYLLFQTRVGVTAERIAVDLNVPKRDVDRELSVMKKAQIVRSSRAFWPIGSPRTWWSLKC